MNSVYARVPVAAASLVLAAQFILAGESSPGGLDKIDVPSPVPTRIYSVQLVATLEEQVAKELQSRAKAVGYQPVGVAYETPYYRAKVGQLENYPDAHELKDDLRLNGFPDAFVVTQPNEERVEAQPIALSGKANKLQVASLPNASLCRTVPVNSLELGMLPTPDKIAVSQDFEQIAADLK